VGGSARRTRSTGGSRTPLLPSSARDLLRFAVLLAWIPVILLTDHALGGIVAQRLLGIGTWLLLLAMLRGETRRTKAQVAIVVAFASLIEYTFAGLLGVYVYRLHNVPWFVPPGHGLVYLGALTFGRTAWAQRHRTAADRRHPGRWRRLCALGRLRVVAVRQPRRVLVRLPGAVPLVGPGTIATPRSTSARSSS